MGAAVLAFTTAGIAVLTTGAANLVVLIMFAENNKLVVDRCYLHLP